MSFISIEEVESRDRLNLAPMIDFLFVMLIFFASLAVSRVATKDTEVNLVKVASETHSTASPKDAEKTIITIHVTADGTYKWVTAIHDYKMSSAQEVARELRQQHQKELLPKDKSKTQILTRIDKDAAWEPIVKLLFAVREEGFDIRPVYEPEMAKVVVAE